MFAGLAVLPLFAQSTAPAADPEMGRATTDMTRTTDTDDDDFNFGWLGLLGLAGLAGMGRKRHGNTDVRTDNLRTGQSDMSRDRI